MKKFFLFPILIIFTFCTKNIQSYLTVNENNINFDYYESSFNIIISTNVDYEIHNEYEWIKLSENKNNTFTIYCDKNETSYDRKAVVSIVSDDCYQPIHIVQNHQDNTIWINPYDRSSLYVHTNQPGILYKMSKMYFDDVDVSFEYGEEEWNGIEHLIITGIMDARDFSTIKWNFRNLKYIDLSKVEIASYYGDNGTNEGYYSEDYSSTCYYPENEIPLGSFFYWCEHDKRNFPSELYDEGYHSLRKIVLPDGIKKIGRNAFARNYNLEEINIPEGVEVVDFVAFRYCTSIKSLTLPSTVTEIGYLTFTDMYSLKELHIKAKTAPTIDKSFGNYPDGDIRGFVSPDETKYSQKTNATLYVPKGCLYSYKSWGKYFNNIIEE